MQMPVLVGVIVAVILLVSFSGWFYNLFQGWKEYVLDDAFFWYRVGAATVFSITLMTLTFFGMAYAYECPGVENDGSSSLSEKLNCPAFKKLKTSAEDIFNKSEEPETETEVDLWESQTEEI